MELTSILEVTAVALSIAYVILAAQERIWCWTAALASSALFAVITWQAQLVGESLINLFYMAMAVYGWSVWRSGSGQNAVHPIMEWPLRWHLALIAGGLLAAVLLGTAFDQWFGSAMPYLDALTSVMSVIATFMVARKVLSNWLYWVMIDSLNVYLYWQRDLKVTSALFVLYTLLALWAYIRWRNRWTEGRTS